MEPKLPTTATIMQFAESLRAGRFCELALAEAGISAELFEAMFMEAHRIRGGLKHRRKWTTRLNDEQRLALLFADAFDGVMSELAALDLEDLLARELRSNRWEEAARRLEERYPEHWGQPECSSVSV